MSETRPHLEIVGSETGKGAAEAADASLRHPQPEGPSPRRAIWLVAVLLALACLALVIQTRRVGALSGEVTRLSSELVGTRAALVAYEGRLATVREIVGDLSQRLGQLDELVRRDPLAPPEAAAAGAADPDAQDAPAPDAP